jgi:hypothetical protein
MAIATLVWPRLSRKTAGANFMSPAKDLDPDRLTMRRLNVALRAQARLTLALANPRTRGRQRICQRIIELDEEIGRCRAALAAGWRP